MGMLVMRMLWLMLALFAPNSSDVIDTAAENVNPELSPIRPVEVCNTTSLPDAISKKKAIGVARTETASQPVLVKSSLLH